jgi:hypothetical protein
MSRYFRVRLVRAIALGSVVAMGCSYKVTEPYQEDIALLRGATQDFADVAEAAAAGYNAQITNCMSDAALGGMGFHIGSDALIDGTVELERPEVLLYEPQADSTRELVAVEYIVPFGLWTEPNPPVLMGQTFKRNEDFGVWALHVWLYRTNPTGLFSDWNPRVSCAAAPAGSMRGT